MKRPLNSQSNNLRNSTLGGMKWGVIDRTANIIVQFAVGIVLARLLPPEDFGLIGLALIIVGFSQIFVNLGLGPALIQRQFVNEKHIRACFTISGLAGLLIAVIVFFSAVPLANLLGTLKVIPILKALSIVFVLKGLEIPSLSLLKKWLDFKHIFYVNIIRLFFYGTVTIVLALNGFGVWSLVIGTIVMSFSSLLLNYFFVRHNIIPLFPKQEIKDLSYFGTGMTINGIFNYFALKGDYFLVGRILGAYELGLYTRAYTLMQMPTTQLVSILSNVLFPVTSVIQNDLEKTKKVFIKSIKIVSFLITPLCMSMIILAPDIIIGLYGKKWAPAIIPLQILGAVGFLRATYNIGGSFLRAKGLVFKLFWANVAYGISMLCLVWIGAHQYGMMGASVAVSLSIVIIWALIMYFNGRMLDMKFQNIIKLHIPGFVLGIMVSVLLFAFRNILLELTSNHIIILLICGPVLCLIMLFSFYVIPKRFLLDIPDIMLDLVNGLKMNVRLKNRLIKYLEIKSAS